MIRIREEPKTVAEMKAELRALRAAGTYGVVAVTKPVTKPKGGRPKRYETAAERQAAYRARKKTNG